MRTTYIWLTLLRSNRIYLVNVVSFCSIVINLDLFDILGSPLFYFDLKHEISIAVIFA